MTPRRDRSSTGPGRSPLENASPSRSGFSRRRSSTLSAIRSTSSTKAPLGIRLGARAISAGRQAKPGATISDLVEPISANKNLQALALEQVKYPRDLPLAVLMAYSDAGDIVDLTSRVQADGRLDWIAPQGRWTLYALFAGWHGKLVERAAPGGEGFVIDHFSTDAIRQYLLPFDRAFAGHRLSGLRAFFNDSYEVDDATGEADWTPRFFAEFEKRRGYDLRRHLPALLGGGDGDTGARVLADYRETISDLLLETFTTEWAAWARRHGRLVRNQAHGSPASLLDLYAASDIPETEGAEIQRFRWATSAAHVAGRRLVSAEAATWLGEHFSVRLADVRAAVDRFFVAGVNHIVYHGTAYSPVGDPWPGWQFYASVEFNPRNAWWDDFGALNAYVARVQSFMQSGRPDTDVLLYYPLYESLAVRGKTRLAHFGGAAPAPLGTMFENAAETLQAAGFTYDFISDRQVRGLRTGPKAQGPGPTGPDAIRNGRITAEGGSSYRTIVLPSSRYVPVETVIEILELARQGATVVSYGGWPADVSGVSDLDGKRARFKAAIGAIAFGPPALTVFGKPPSAAAVSCKAAISTGSSRAPTCSASQWSTRACSSRAGATPWAASISSATRATAHSTAGSHSTCVRRRSWRSIR